MTMHKMPWTPEQDIALREYLHQGFTARRIAFLMGRTRSAIINRAVLIEATSCDGSKSIILASAHLREAMMDAICAYANHHGINATQAQAILMGDTHIQRLPGTERIYKTCDTERLAA